MVNSAFKTVFNVAQVYMKSAPVDIFAIIRECGIKFKQIRMEDNLSGYIEALNGNFLIAVNANHAITRQRFTAAHELGHYAYHRDLIDKGIDDTKAYRSAPGGKFYNEYISDWHESEANRFAANVLMPLPLIRKYQKYGLKTPSELANQFLVSEQSMSIRLSSTAQKSLFEDDEGELLPELGVPTFARSN